MDAHLVAPPRFASLARHSLRMLLALALLGPALAARAAPATFLVTKFTDTADGVCNSADCSLREALIAANSNPGADTIVVPAGNYSLSLAGAGEDLAATGDLDIRDALTWVPGGVATVSASAGWDDRIIHVLPGVAATLSSVTIAGGKLAADIGGGVFNQGGLTLSDSTITTNTAAAGGGIANTGTLALWRVTVISNTASGSASGGGGIISAGGLTVYASTINGNNATGVSGGGILAMSATTIGASVISGNSAASGGGLSLSATTTITDSTISGNSASLSGGGAVNTTLLTLIGSTVSGNNASTNGGGLLNNGTLAVSNSTLSGNSATSGGGLANTNSATLASATIARNTATGSGGGVLNGAGKTTTLKNTLLAENTGGTGPDCAGTLLSQGYNLVTTVGGACAIGATTGDKLNQDALLLALADNGGPTRTHALLAVSPAIDAGNPASPGSGGNACPATDQRGVGRPQTGRCDIGAFELPGVSIVDFAFQPTNLVVSTGTTVRWKNTGASSHTTISDPNGFENWVSPLLNTGAVFLHTFNNNGSYNYHCSIHPGMVGKITVVGQPTSPTPLLSNLSPNTAAAGSPELTLTLTGLNFDVNATVEWNSTTLQLLSVSAEQFVAKVPAALLASAGFANVRVVNPAQTGGASNTLKFTITAVAQPILNVLSPASAPAGSPAFTLTLLGSNFDAAATVRWNDTTLTPATVAPGQITVQVPANLLAAAGSASVKVANPPGAGGESNARTFTITNIGESPVPAITNISPNSAFVRSGPLTLTITGAGFVPGSTVQFGGVTLTPDPSAISSGQIVVTIPANLLLDPGVFSVSVTNPQPGGGLSNSILFHVNEAHSTYLPLARK